MAAGALALVAVVAPAGGLRYLADHPVVEADFAAAMRYIANHHAPGQPVITAFPPVAYLALGARDDLLYLVRLGDGPLVQPYTVRTAAGTEVDRWVGSPVVASVADLCHLLEQQPEAPVVADEGRLDAEWGYSGAAVAVLRGATVRIFDAAGGAFVSRPALPSDWSPAARDACQSTLRITDAGAEPGSWS